VRFLSVSLLLFFNVSLPAYSAETEWHNHQDILQTRLVVASSDLFSEALPDEQGIALLGWEAQLSPGWKTYWRSPGEAGLPVRLKAGEQEQEIFYPFPERFSLFGLETYGYSHKVILPFVLKHNSKIGAVKLKADFMVCKDICIPMTSSYTLSAEQLTANNGSHDIRFKRWLDRVPDRQGDAGANLTIESVKAMGPTGWQKLVVEVKADRQLTSADLLVEATDKFHFASPKIRLVGDGTKARFVVGSMAAKNAPDLQGQDVRLTFADGHGAVIDRVVTVPIN